MALRKSVARAEVLRAHGVRTVSVCSDLQAAIRRTVELDPGPGERLARAIYEHARALRTHGIEAAIHWVPGHLGIPKNEEADCQANKAREDRGGTVCERTCTSAANRARQLSQAIVVVKAMWEANKCSKHYGYRLESKGGSKRSVPMIRVESLTTMFYRLKSRHVPIGTYLKWFGHQDDIKCRWCESRMRPNAAGGETSRLRSGRRWERPPDGKQAGASIRRNLSLSPRNNAIKW